MNHWLLRLVLLIAGSAGIAFNCAAQRSVEVNSLDQQAGLLIAMPGFWFPVETTTAAPAILLLHGCGGPYNSRRELALRYRSLAARLNALGVHVLVTDSLTPRGERELCTQRNGSRAVTQSNRRRDVLGALNWLATQPGVDPQRLGILGWSNGGSAVLASTNRRHAEVAAAKHLPSLAVAFYPGCETELTRGYESVAPLLMLVGAADDWTPAEPCIQLAGKASAGAALQIEVYPDAFHGFDGTAPVRLRTDVPNGVRPGEGVHVGSQPAARAASAAALEAFLRRHWQLD